MRTPYLAALIACVIATPLPAQEPAPVATPPALPPGPLLKPASNSAEWTVIFKVNATESGEGESSNGSQKKSPEKRITITKSGAVRREVLVDEAGARSETWTFGGYRVTLRQGSPIPGVAIVGTQKANAARLDFPDFEWISAKNYTGIAKSNGRDCLTFRGESGGTDPDMPSLVSTATVDVETRWPLSLVLADETRTYVYAAAPGAPLVPPQEAQDAVKAWQKHLEDISRPSPRPF